MIVCWNSANTPAMGPIVIAAPSSRTGRSVLMPRSRFRSTRPVGRSRGSRGAAGLGRAGRPPPPRGAAPESFEQWQAAYGLSPQRHGRFTTLSGEPITALYTEADLPRDAAEPIGFPGQYPYTRGVYGSMYRGHLWTMRQFAGFGPPRRQTSASATCSTTARRPLN